jgi:magnesium transporter
MKNKKRLSKTGLPPGTHIYTGKNVDELAQIELFSFDKNKCRRKKLNHTEPHNFEPELNHWINIFGVHDPVVIKTYCDLLNVHHLYQEDIMNVFQRPKVEEEDDYIFVALKAFDWKAQANELEDEQISIILSKNFVITFQEKPGDHFDMLRERLLTDGSIIRERNIDYLFYRILDISVDVYFDLIEKMGDFLETTEEMILAQPENGILTRIQSNKKDIIQMRKMIYPMRDLVARLISSDHPLIELKTKKYLRDVQDHTIQIMETLETYRDVNYGLKDLYLNAMSHEMNRIMKILTIISTFFIPLTFIVGVYGMNFKHMPELHWPYGYYMVWSIMIALVVFLSVWFKRKGWF